MTRFENRHDIAVLPDSDLLESQRTLLDLDVLQLGNHRRIWGLGEKDINLLGNLLGEEIAQATIDRYGDKGGRIHAELLSRARQLTAFKNEDAVYRPVQKEDLLIHENYQIVNVETLNEQRLNAAFQQQFSNTNTVYTPTGLVHPAPEDLRQAVLSFDIRHHHSFSDIYTFNFSSQKILRFYTDNLAATPPLWEWQANPLVSDILPGGGMYLYDMHLPQGFNSEELALSAMQRIASLFTPEKAAEH